MGRQVVSFSYLLFADDYLFFFQNDNCSLPNLKNTILWYCSISGQSINLTKSDLFCSPNISLDDQQSLAAALQVNLVQNPSRYLGINFKFRGRRVADFLDLVDRVQTKLQGWKAKLLTKVGKATLIYSVLQPCLDTPFPVLEYLRLLVINWMLSFGPFGGNMILVQGIYTWSIGI